MLKLFAVACLLGVAASAPFAEYAAVDSYAYPRYGFNYAVSDPHTGDHKAQSEHRDGGVVKGSYSLSEPDGTLRVVDYTADPHTGFNAVVKRLGPAAHPVMKPAPIMVAHAPVIAPAVSHWGHGWNANSWGSHGMGAWGAHGDIGLGYSGHSGLVGLGGHGGFGLGGHGGFDHGGLSLGGHGDYGLAANAGWGHGH